MHSSCSAAVIGLAAVWLSGCSTAQGISGMKPQSISDKTPTQQIEALQPQYNSTAVAACEAVPSSTTQSTQCRDNIVLAKLTALDISFETFEWAAWGSDAGFSTLSDFAVLGLTAAGGLSPTGAAQILSATAAAVTGAKTSVEKNFLYSKTIDQLIFSMSVTRAQLRTHILSCLSLPANEYTVNMALYDTELYKNAGILPAAIANLTSTATGNGVPTLCGTAQAPTPPAAAPAAPVSPAPVAPAAPAPVAPAPAAPAPPTKHAPPPAAAH